MSGRRERLDRLEPKETDSSVASQIDVARRDPTQGDEEWVTLPADQLEFRFDRARSSKQ